VFFSIRFPHQNLVCTYPLPLMCYMPHPSLSCFSVLNNIPQGVKIMKFHCTISFSRPKYLLQYPILEHPEPIFCQLERPSFTPMYDDKITVLHSLIFMFLESKQPDKTFWTEFSLFFINAVLIC